MLLLHFTALLLLKLPHLITAQCPACDSYSAALKTCQSQTTTSNLTTTGDTMDTASIECMCVKNSGTEQMDICHGCLQNTLDWDVSLLLGWYITCSAKDDFGDEQAVACWEGQLDHLTPCFPATVRNGGGVSSGRYAGDDEEPRSVLGSLNVGFSLLICYSMSTPEASVDESASAATRFFDGIGASLPFWLVLLWYLLFDEG